VSVTGARADQAASRELFTEESNTVLVFRDGAVIRLSAPVAVGQLLFLTDKKSKAEVVCQVLNIRTCNESASYVDLQFTEDKPAFWDVPFPSDAKTAPEFSVKEHVEAEAATSGAPTKSVEPRKPEEVDQLRKEVEALRTQLLELEKKNTAAPGKGASSGVPPPKISPAPLEPDPKYEYEQVETSMTSNFEGRPPTSALEPSAQPEPSTAADPRAPLMPAAKEPEKTAPARPVVSMSLPIRITAEQRKNKGPNDTIDELLPKPALDFSQVPARAAPQEPLGLLRRRRPLLFELRIWLMPGLAGLLVLALIVSAWVFTPWKYLGGKKTGEVAAASAVTPAATKPSVARGSAVANKPNTDADRGGGRSASSENVAAIETDHSADPEDADSRTPETAEQTAKKFVSAKARTKISIAPKAAADKPDDTSSGDAPVLPAKLVKAANPVYPPDAMLSFITGDVRAEAVVEADGRVDKVNILSGPKPLRDAAVQALKQYQYEPATQGGKAVPSRVTVTVKFWFDP
jgi:TonB family protein